MTCGKKTQKTQNICTRLSRLFQPFYPTLHLRKEVENPITRRNMQAKPRQLFRAAFCIFRILYAHVSGLIMQRGGVRKGKDRTVPQQLFSARKKHTQCMSSP